MTCSSLGLMYNSTHILDLELLNHNAGNFFYSLTGSYCFLDPRSSFFFELLPYFVLSLFYSNFIRKDEWKENCLDVEIEKFCTPCSLCEWWCLNMGSAQFTQIYWHQSKYLRHCPNCFKPMLTFDCYLLLDIILQNRNHFLSEFWKHCF